MESNYQQRTDLLTQRVLLEAYLTTLQLDKAYNLLSKDNIDIASLLDELAKAKRNISEDQEEDYNKVLDKVIKLFNLSGDVEEYIKQLNKLKNIDHNSRTAGVDSCDALIGMMKCNVNIKIKYAYVNQFLTTLSMNEDAYKKNETLFKNILKEYEIYLEEQDKDVN